MHERAGFADATGERPAYPRAPMDELPLINLAVLATGLVALTWGANRFAQGAEQTARLLGVPPMVVGLTIVAFATSAPEMLVSATAAASGSSDMGIGNALGSNITNLGLVLGAVAVVRPVSLPKALLRRELPLLFVAMALTLGLLWDYSLDRIDGVILVLGLLGFMLLMVRDALRARADYPRREQETLRADGLPRAALELGGGLVVLLVSSRVLVWSASNLARLAGVSELVIGLTVVALGTSLPELAASVASARRGQPEIAVGNVIGSNLFNLMAVLSLPALIAPQSVAPAVLQRDYAVMVGVTVAAVGFARGGPPHKLGRFAGSLLLLSYVAYAGYLFVWK